MMEPIFSFEKPEDSKGYLLWQLSMSWQRTMNRALSAFEITHTQFVILAALGWLTRDGKKVTQMEISNHSQIDRMMLSKVLDTLQKKGWVLRTNNPEDKRAKHIKLTESGVNLFNQAIKAAETHDEQFFELAEGSVDEFHQVMKVLVEKNRN